MKEVLLLILSLMAGREASSNIKGCPNEWVEFNCEYPNKSITKYKSVWVTIPNQSTTLQILLSNQWEKHGRWSLYHDTEKRHLRQIVKQLERKDFGTYTYAFYPSAGSTSDTKKVELKLAADNCECAITRTLNRTHKTNFTCTKKTQFFCKDNGVICEDILSTRSLPSSNGRFTWTKSGSSFNISIRDVTSEDDGIYWCGGKSEDGNHRAGHRKVVLKVQASPPPNSAAPSVTAPSVTAPSTTPEVYQGPPNTKAIAAALVCVALLAFVFILAFGFYKRLKKTTNGRAQINREDHIYAEIQEPDETERSVANVIYVSASFQKAP